MMDPNSNKEELKKVKDDLNLEIINYKGILARQLTTGIWKEPHPSFPAKLKERRALEAEISAITGQTFLQRKGEEIYELNFSNLVSELKKS